MMEHFDAIYILRDSGIRLFSKTNPCLQRDDGSCFDDLITAFFSAITDLADVKLGQDGISSIHFMSGRRLYYKNYKVGEHVLRFVLITTKIQNGKDPYNRIIDSKSIEVKWIMNGLLDYLDSASIPNSAEKEIDEKITALFS